MLGEGKKGKEGRKEESWDRKHGSEGRGQKGENAGNRGRTSRLPLESCWGGITQCWAPGSYEDAFTMIRCLETLPSTARIFSTRLTHHNPIQTERKACLTLYPSFPASLRSLFLENVYQFTFQSSTKPWSTETEFYSLHFWHCLALAQRKW